MKAMKLIKGLWQKHWPVFLLFCLLSVLFFSNFKAETMLTGWDNLHPELGVGINLKRTWQGVWQEYQGLGLLAGMAHGADLLRAVLFLPFNILLPIELSRYFFFFTTLLAGVWGAQLFLEKLLEKEKLKKWQIKLAAFLGSSFYLLNLGTLQNFYVPYEPFAIFFAIFPWQILTLWKSLESSEKRDYIKFAIVSLLGTAAYYVQTIFVVYVLIVALFLTSYFWMNKKDNKLWQKIRKIILILFFTNAFWLLPNIYFTLTNSSVAFLAKNNQMVTEEIVLRNAKFGQWSDILRLRGYWFDYQDFDQFGNLTYLLDEWKTHLNFLPARIASYLPGFLVLLAILLLTFKKKLNKRIKKVKPFILLLFFLIIFILLGDNPPMGFIYRISLDYLPFFKQIFRSSFTKWVVPAVFIFSILISVFFSFLFIFLKKAKIKFRQQFLSIFSAFIFFASLLLVSLPSFQGNFFYSRLRVKIPDPYFQLFDYFKNEAPESSRIANFPQHTFNGWQWNDWGYRGSGFIWYGIEQPIMDRAFDVWSSDLENYYWQLQTAIDQQDIRLFEMVLQKYDIDYLLLDESILNRNTNKPFDFKQWEAFFSESEEIQLIREFDFIKLYQFSDDEDLLEQNFVSLYEILPQINNSHQFLWQDQAYLDFGDYLNASGVSANSIYLFPSLFTNHSQAELEFNLSEDEDNFYLSPGIPLANLDLRDLSLQVKSYLLTEKYLPANITWQTEGKTTTLIIKAILPSIQFATQSFSWQLKKEIDLDSAFCQQTNDCWLAVNNQHLSSFTPSGELNTLLRSGLRNTIALKPADKPEYFAYQFLDLQAEDLQQQNKSLSENVPFMLTIPKFKTSVLGENLLTTEMNKATGKNCRSFSSDSFYKEKRPEGNYYASVNANSCDSFYLPELDHAQSYLVTAKTQNWQSLPLLFAVQAPSLGRSPIETYLQNDVESQVNYLIIPPLENFNAGYSLYLATDSFGREMNENLLENMEVYQWPYSFLKNLQLVRTSRPIPETTISKCDFSAEKKTLFFYKIKLGDNCERVQTLKLSQAYSEGWLATTRLDNGFLNYHILDHNKLNSWANAWQIEEIYSGQVIYLFFWPQALEYLGFILLVISAAYFLWSRKK